MATIKISDLTKIIAKVVEEAREDYYDPSTKTFIDPVKQLDIVKLVTPGLLEYIKSNNSDLSVTDFADLSQQTISSTDDINITKYDITPGQVILFDKIGDKYNGILAGSYLIYKTPAGYDETYNIHPRTINKIIKKTPGAVLRAYSKKVSGLTGVLRNREFSRNKAQSELSPEQKMRDSLANRAVNKLMKSRRAGVDYKKVSETALDGLIAIIKEDIEAGYITDYMENELSEGRSWSSPVKILIHYIWNQISNDRFGKSDFDIKSELYEKLK